MNLNETVKVQFFRDQHNIVYHYCLLFWFCCLENFADRRKARRETKNLTENTMQWLPAALQLCLKVLLFLLLSASHFKPKVFYMMLSENCYFLLITLFDTHRQIYLVVLVHCF